MNDLEKWLRENNVQLVKANQFEQIVGKKLPPDIEAVAVMESKECAILLSDTPVSGEPHEIRGKKVYVLGIPKEEVKSNKGD